MQEACAVAITLIGLTPLQNRAYWMQIVSDKEQHPDVRSGYGESEVTWMSQPIEVVTFDYHSKEESISDFLIRTKLAKRGAYRLPTTVLCVVDRNLQLIDFEKISEAVKHKESAPPMIIVMGKTSSIDGNMYKIAQITPVISLIREFDLRKELLTDKRDPILILKRGRGLDSKIPLNEKYCPFEKLGIIPAHSGSR